MLDHIRLDAPRSAGQVSAESVIRAVEVSQHSPNGGDVSVFRFPSGSTIALTPLEGRSMTHRVRSAFGRFLVTVAAAAVAFAFATATAAAQQTTGKIEGTVTDQQGAPVANAQVFIVGTSFGAVADAKGYYFMNNVPVGTYTIRAQFIGFAPTEVREFRVLGGQTMTNNIKMSSSAVVVTGITVVGASNVYIDGTPVRSQNAGSQAITVGTNAVEEASVTTGAIGVEFGDAQSGVIAYTTRSGGQKLEGTASYESDEPFGNSVSTGYNRFEGNIGGPIPGLTGLRFFASGVVAGRVAGERGWGWDQVPTYTLGGIDTTMSVVTSTGTQQVVVPRFVQASGQCDASANFGFEWQGRRFPMDWRMTVQTSAKVSYSYGSGPSASLAVHG